MRLRERHGHVEVEHAGLARRGEDRRIEARVTGVDDRIGARRAQRRDDGGTIRGVEDERVDAAAPMPGGDALGALTVDVGQRDVLDKGTRHADVGDRTADAAGSHNQ
jgi:hypothetical protein